MRDDQLESCRTRTTKARRRNGIEKRPTTHVMTMQSTTCPNWEKASRSESLLVPLCASRVERGQLLNRILDDRASPFPAGRGQLILLPSRHDSCSGTSELTRRGFRYCSTSTEHKSQQAAPRWRQIWSAVRAAQRVCGLEVQRSSSAVRRTRLTSLQGSRIMVSTMFRTRSLASA